MEPTSNIVSLDYYRKRKQATEVPVRVTVSAQSLLSQLTAKMADMAIEIEKLKAQVDVLPILEAHIDGQRRVIAALVQAATTKKEDQKVP